MLRLRAHSKIIESEEDMELEGKKFIVLVEQIFNDL